MNSGKTTEYKGYVQILIGGALWGTIGLFVLLLEQCGSNATFTSFLRMTFSFLIMFAITSFKFGIRAFKVDKKTLLSCAILGVLCQALNGLLYSFSIVEIRVSFSAILMNVGPPFTAFLSWLLFSEKVTAVKKIAMFINILGCILAVTGGNIENNGVSFIGILYGVGAGLACALMPIIGKIIGANCSVYVMGTYGYFFAIITLLIFTNPLQYISLINGKMLIVGFLFALIATVIAYLFYYMGVQNVKEMSKVPVIASVETVVSVMIGVYIYNEPLGLVNIAGVILVMGSILLMNKKAE